jgi:Fe-S-cluster containining protein
MSKQLCENKLCIQCCLTASVPLLNEDVNDIIQCGFYDAYFVNADDGVKLIRTWSDGSCIFYKKDTRECEVYDHRPTICRLRPYTIRNDTHEPGVDNDCRFSSECVPDQAVLKKMKRYFDTLQKEIEWRRKTGYF